MASAEIASIVVEEEKKSMDIVVKHEQLSQAIGRSGQNVRLASSLSGWNLNVITQDEAENRTKKESASLINLFTKSLDVDKDLADILVQEGFTSLEDIAYAPIEDLSGIEGFDEDIANALRNRARDTLLEQTLLSNDKVGAAEPAKDLLEMEGMSRHLAYVLANNGIVTREDLAEQSVDDLLTVVKDLTEKQAAKLIMTARKPWFEAEK
jgi:N utilization substance protein A